MSPVSRGRKAKQSNKRKNKRASTKPKRSGPPELSAMHESALTVFDRFLGPPERPQWFDESINRVLDHAGVVTSARGPRELDRITAELLGAELHRAVHEGQRGLRFGWWFAELVDAATDRIRKEADDGSWEPSYWLLYGLAAIAPPSLAPRLSEAERWLPDDATARLPAWLADVPRITATGEVCRMRDDYGTRFAVIAGFCYPHGRDPSVFLFDIDASGFVTLAGADVFDDLEQAATAWRAQVGDAAGHARPEPVEDAAELLSLAQCDVSDEFGVRGDEPRRVMDNWFRAERRIHDLGVVLRKRGMPLPTVASQYPLDQEVTAVMAERFTGWYADAHGTGPDPDAVAALADEWTEGTLPETWYAASPRRVEFQFELIGDWIPDDPVTLGVRALMPEWVRWLGERAGLAEHLRERVIAAASVR